LRESCAHEQASVTAAHDREMGGRGVFLVDEILGASEEVVEYVLFVGKSSGLLPSSPYSRRREDWCRRQCPLIEPQARGVSLKEWLCADAVAAVAGEQCRMGGVELGSLQAKILRGTRVPSLEVANSRTTSASSSLIGEVSNTPSEWPFRWLRHIGTTPVDRRRWL